MEEPLTGLLSCFFSLCSADLALRLGPDSERSVKKSAKNMKLFGFRGTSLKQKQREQTKNGTSDDPQISRHVLVLLAPFTDGPVLEKAGWMGPFGGKFHS